MDHQSYATNEEWTRDAIVIHNPRPAARERPTLTYAYLTGSCPHWPVREERVSDLLFLVSTKQRDRSRLMLPPHSRKKNKTRETLPRRHSQTRCWHLNRGSGITDHRRTIDWEAFESKNSSNAVFRVVFKLSRSKQTIGKRNICLKAQTDSWISGHISIPVWPCRGTHEENDVIILHAP